MKKKLLMPLLVASLLITTVFSFSSCKKTNVSDEEVFIDEVIIKDRAQMSCPICGYLIVSNGPLHTHEYFIPDTCPLGEWDDVTHTGCFWFHKVHHIHRYQIEGNGNIIWQNEHLGGGTIIP